MSFDVIVLGSANLDLVATAPYDGRGAPLAGAVHAFTGLSR